MAAAATSKLKLNHRNQSADQYSQRPQAEVNGGAPICRYAASCLQHGQPVSLLLPPVRGPAAITGATSGQGRGGSSHDLHGGITGKASAKSSAQAEQSPRLGAAAASHGSTPGVAPARPSDPGSRAHPYMFWFLCFKDVAALQRGCPGDEIEVSPARADREMSPCFDDDTQEAAPEAAAAVPPTLVPPSPVAQPGGVVEDSLPLGASATMFGEEEKKEAAAAAAAEEEEAGKPEEAEKVEKAAEEIEEKEADVETEAEAEAEAEAEDNTCQLFQDAMVNDSGGPGAADAADVGVIGVPAGQEIDRGTPSLRGDNDRYRLVVSTDDCVSKQHRQPQPQLQPQPQPQLRARTNSKENSVPKRRRHDGPSEHHGSGDPGPTNAANGSSSQDLFGNSDTTTRQRLARLCLIVMNSCDQRMQTAF